LSNLNSKSIALQQKGVQSMHKFKLSVSQWLNPSNVRVIIALSILLIAALVGGAPNDVGH
jgi:hypothetical protein